MRRRFILFMMGLSHKVAMFHDRRFTRWINAFNYWYAEYKKGWNRWKS